MDRIVPSCAANIGSWCERIWNDTGISWLAENIDSIFRHGLRVLLIVIISLIVRFVGRRAIDRFSRAAANGGTPAVLQPLRDRADTLLAGSGTARRQQRAASIGSLLKSILSFVVFTVMLILVLAEVGINVGPILASAGIAGIALGFGAQNLVKDFLSGIFMLLEDQYGVGDVVDLGEVKGTVTAVSLRTTTVRGPNGAIWYVRNGEVIRVGNSSKGEAVVIIDLPLSYRADAEQAGVVALQAATEVAESEDFADLVTAAPDMQGVVAMAADSVTIRLVSTVQAGEQWKYDRAVRSAVKAAFDTAGIQPPASDLRRWSTATPPEQGPGAHA